MLKEDTSPKKKSYNCNPTQKYMHRNSTSDFCIANATIHHKITHQHQLQLTVVVLLDVLLVPFFIFSVGQWKSLGACPVWWKGPIPSRPQTFPLSNNGGRLGWRKNQKKRRM